METTREAVIEQTHVPLIKMKEKDRRRIIENLAQGFGVRFAGYEPVNKAVGLPSLNFTSELGGNSISLPFDFSVQLSFYVSDEETHDLTPEQLAFSLSRAAKICKQIRKLQTRVPVNFLQSLGNVKTLARAKAA